MPEDRFKRRRKAADKPVLATKPGEVVVSRRLYRSGQSEYLINGRTGRLRDIQEMFMGVGLGPDSYAIIEQGRIGQILSTKPMERRAIIEEAAGVTKFKTKKRLAEAKLESSKVNLSRVNDIVVEVEKQLGSLKRQAAKARRYSEVRDQMRAIVRQMLAGKARELDAEAERLAKQLQELSTTETRHATEILQQEGEQDRLNQRIYALDAELRQNQNVLNHTTLEADRSENRIGFNRTRAEELAARRGQISAEMSQASAQASEWETRSAAQQHAVASVRAESSVLNTRAEELGARAASRAAQITESEARIEALRRSASEAGESLLRLHGEQKQAEEALVHQSEALHKLETNESALLESSINIRQDAENAARDWQASTNQLGALNHRATELQAQIADLRQQRETATKESDSLRDSLASVRARHSTLTQILNDRSYTADAVQKLFAANERGGAKSRHECLGRFLARKHEPQQRDRDQAGDASHGTVESRRQSDVVRVDRHHDGGRQWSDACAHPQRNQESGREDIQPIDHALRFNPGIQCKPESDQAGADGERQASAVACSYAAHQSRPEPDQNRHRQ
jgi:chromosome segregation protein